MGMSGFRAVPCKLNVQTHAHERVMPASYSRTSIPVVCSAKAVLQQP